MELLENALKEDRERLEAAEIHAALTNQQRTDERRQRILTKMEQIQQREVKQNLKASFYARRHNEQQACFRYIKLYCKGFQF